MSFDKEGRIREATMNALGWFFRNASERDWNGKIHLKIKVSRLSVFVRPSLDSGRLSSMLANLPPRRPIQPYPSAFPAYPELPSLTWGFGFALSIVPSILGAIIVHPVVTQKRRKSDGKEVRQQKPSRA